jgi:hypothetical protein
LRNFIVLSVLCRREPRIEPFDRGASARHHLVMIGARNVQLAGRRDDVIAVALRDTPASPWPPSVENGP